MPTEKRTPLDKLKNGDNDYTRYLETLFAKDSLEIVKVTSKHNSLTFGVRDYYECYIDGYQQGQVYSTWQTALIGGLSVMQGGPNSQAAEFIIKMLGLECKFNV